MLSRVSRKVTLVVAALALGFILILFAIFNLHLLWPGNLTDIPAEKKSQPKSTAMALNIVKDSFISPLPRSRDRITKKSFGLYVSPKNSPVTPEKFQGYHTGVDFEVFENEQETPISVTAVCSGESLQKGFISGYGGVAIQSCDLKGEPITVLYGHLKVDSLTKNPGDQVTLGDSLGVLGKGYSSETDGERKHLHLGFHWGTEINFRGYVTSPEELKNWIDPCQYVCQ